MAVLLLSSCHTKPTRSEKAETTETTEEEQQEIYVGKTMDEVTIEEVEELYKDGGYGFNIAGYDFTFTQYLAYNPATMHYPFTKLRNSEESSLGIADSPDGKIRFYEWISEMGGSYINWDAMYQIDDHGTIYTFSGLPDWDSEYAVPMDIFLLPHKKKDYYIFIYYIREWSSQSYYAAVSYELTGGTLKRVELFTDSEGKPTDRIDYEYNVPDYYFRFARACGFDYHFYFDEATSTLYYPLGWDEDYLIMTDRYIPYRWDGKSIKRQTQTVGNPDLHTSLQDYVCLIQTLRIADNDTVLARIDSLADGSYRYAAWRSKPMSAKPSVLIYNGTADTARYYFHADTITYAVTKESTPIMEVYKNSGIGTLGKLQRRFESLD